MHVDPYLYFNGHCEEAISFYRSSIGAELIALTRFGQFPDVPAPATAQDKIMHASIRVGETTILASDGQCQGSTNFQGFSLSLAVVSNGQAEQLFTALAAGGQIQVPLAATPFASRFGIVADRFGVVWIVTTSG